MVHTVTTVLRNTIWRAKGGRWDVGQWWSSREVPVSALCVMLAGLQQQSIHIVQYGTRQHGCPVIDPVGFTKQHNLGEFCLITLHHWLPGCVALLTTLFLLIAVRVLQGREIAGPLQRRQAVPTRLYSKQQLFSRTLGHLSAVYCLLFDRSGRYVITVSICTLQGLSQMSSVWTVSWTLWSYRTKGMSRALGLCHRFLVSHQRKFLLSILMWHMETAAQRSTVPSHRTVNVGVSLVLYYFSFCTKINLTKAGLYSKSTIPCQIVKWYQWSCHLQILQDQLKVLRPDRWNHKLLSSPIRLHWKSWSSGWHPCFIFKESWPMIALEWKAQQFPQILAHLMVAG